jgi:galactose mutarotase-like enzyme
MNVLGNQYDLRCEQGFEVYALQNQQAEISVVPELGARIISLKDLRTGREWMWHPGARRRLFRNRVGDDFAGSPLVGLDECVPTIAPCSWRKRELPDHGEVWAAAWSVDPESWSQGRLRTRTRLAVSPFNLERTIELCGNEVRLSYQLSNREKCEEPFLWAMHPLLQLQPGDELELPASTRARLNGAAWVDAVHSAIPPGNCQKLFASPILEGRAAIANPGSGDRLQFEWDARENRALGLWLSRGGWHGHHHFALEPANGAADALAEAAPQRRCAIVPGLGTVSWQVVIRVGT